MEDEPLALLINAGGQSRRMGRQKALLPMPPDDTPMIVNIIRRLALLVTDRIVVVSNDPAVAAVTSALTISGTSGDIVTVTLKDKWPNGGALGGVATGLGMGIGWAMVVACDMPFVDPAIFASMIYVARSRPELEAVIPLVGGVGQPFHGLWHRRALAHLEARLAAGDFGVQAALHDLEVAWLDETALGIEADDLAFFNVNTPQDWDELLAILANRKRPIA